MASSRLMSAQRKSSVWKCPDAFSETGIEVCNIGFMVYPSMRDGNHCRQVVVLSTSIGYHN